MAKQVKKSTIIARCGDCLGTGVYSRPGFPEGCGVLCRNCKGEGRVEIKYTKFTGREVDPKIKTVGLNGFKFLHSGGRETGVNYDEFRAIKLTELAAYVQQEYEEDTESGE